MRKSKSFRNDFALLAANEAQKSDNFANFVYADGFQGRGIGTTSAPLKTPDPIPVKTSLPNTTAKNQVHLRKRLMLIQLEMSSTRD